MQILTMNVWIVRLPPLTGSKLVAARGFVTEVIRSDLLASVHLLSEDEEKDEL